MGDEDPTSRRKYVGGSETLYPVVVWRAERGRGQVVKHTCGVGGTTSEDRVVEACPTRETALTRRDGGPLLLVSLEAPSRGGRVRGRVSAEYEECIP